METPRELPEEFEFRRLTEENITAALKDDKINIIGICWSGGIAKRRMAREIGEKIKGEKLFKVVMMVRVGSSSDLDKVAYEISDYLGVSSKGGDFVARANELLSGLTVEEKVLIILDDVREVFDLEKIGIPLEKHKGSYKIIITSQFKKVCWAMGCCDIFTVQGLRKEDNLIPSRERAGTANDSSDVYSSGRSAAWKRKLDLVQLDLVREFVRLVRDRVRVLELDQVQELDRVRERELEQLDRLDQELVDRLDQVRKESAQAKEESARAQAAKDHYLDSILYKAKLIPDGGSNTKNHDNFSKSKFLPSKLQETKPNGGQILEINNEAKLQVYTNMVLHDKRNLTDFILFCSVFPSDYEFTKDILVWQWIAGGLIKVGEDEIMEEVCIKFFDALLSSDYIVASRYDHFVDQIKYKIGDKMTAFLQKHQKQQLEPKFRKHLDSKEADVAKVEHLSLAFKEIDGLKFGVLKQYSRLQTLIIHRCYGSKVDYLPADLFLELKSLKILNLSHTNIVELPSSVENLKELRYLDMSETPIGWLPETICYFSNLQTLKLDGCLSLDGLPKCTSKLINLRHLVLDVVRQLQSMPIGIGKLSKLRTLSAFLVGEDDGTRIGELKDMKKLRGSLRILNLENVKTKKEAAEAYLWNKQDLRKIELQWSDLEDEKSPYEEEILESLEPPLGIQELKILFYSGGVLPSWICNPSFSELVSLILYRCRYCYSLPSLGELKSLKLLSIIENNEVLEINSFFCGKRTNQHHVAFPKLEKLSFDSMSKLEKWTGLESGDFPSLRHLIIEYCPKFVGLPFLSHLNSLLHLEISDCPELSCLPEGGLPSTLESLMIKDCPKLKGRCCNEQCEDWSKVACVPDFYIDYQKVSP